VAPPITDEEVTVLLTPTKDKLYALNLNGMARAFSEQLERADYQALPFEDRLGLLADRELQERENRRLERNLKAAKLRLPACVEDINFHHPRGLDRTLILNLAEAQWVQAHNNILISGATGAGKTYVACALAHAALRRGYTALYVRAPRMLDELAVARADGRLTRLMLSMARVAVLVIDDFALRPLTSDQSAHLLEVVEDRVQLRATIVTSQLPVSHWHESLGDPSLADAILDRLVHSAVRIDLLHGPSLRGPQSASTSAASDAENGSRSVDKSETAGRSGKRHPTTPQDARD
jgi:DNA replication protein DnaC